MERPIRILLSLLLTITTGRLMAQSVAEAAKASRGNGQASKVIEDDDLQALRAKSSASGKTSSAPTGNFCNSACQGEVLDMLSEKVPKELAQAMLAEGLSSARDDGEWQELAGRVHTSVCNEKKTGTQLSGDADLQREVMVRISREQKDLAAMQEKAVGSGNEADLEELKHRAAKLVVLGVAIKQMAMGTDCPAK